MILWFGKKKKLDEAKAAGAAMPAPELSAEELAAQDAAAREKAEIEAKVAEANRAWEERQRREAQDAADEAVRAKAAAELKLLEERREQLGRVLERWRLLARPVVGEHLGRGVGPPAPGPAAGNRCPAAARRTAGAHRHRPRPARRGQPRILWR